MNDSWNTKPWFLIQSSFSCVMMLRVKVCFGREISYNYFKKAESIPRTVCINCQFVLTFCWLQSSVQTWHTECSLYTCYRSQSNKEEIAIIIQRPTRLPVNWKQPLKWLSLTFTAGSELSTLPRHSVRSSSGYTCSWTMSCFSSLFLPSSPPSMRLGWKSLPWISVRNKAVFEGIVVARLSPFSSSSIWPHSPPTHVQICTSSLPQTIDPQSQFQTRAQGPFPRKPSWMHATDWWREDSRFVILMAGALGWLLLTFCREDSLTAMSLSWMDCNSFKNYIRPVPVTIKSYASGTSWLGEIQLNLSWWRLRAYESVCKFTCLCAGHIRTEGRDMGITMFLKIWGEC